MALPNEKADRSRQPHSGSYRRRLPSNYPSARMVTPAEQGCMSSANHDGPSFLLSLVLPEGPHTWRCRAPSLKSQSSIRETGRGDNRDPSSTWCLPSSPRAEDTERGKPIDMVESTSYGPGQRSLQTQYLHQLRMHASLQALQDVL